MPTVRLVCASANPHKAREIAAILGDSVELLPRPDGVADVDETGETLEANARLKARAVCDATGIAAVADDTGLEVDALGGRPGVRSARYAGDNATDADNVARLLRDLDRTDKVNEADTADTADKVNEADKVDGGARRARFRTVALVVFPDGREVRADGVVEGRIVAAPRGANGFGYDPVFVPDDGDGRTFAEMRDDEKHAISHRGRAFRSLAARLVDNAHESR